MRRLALLLGLVFAIGALGAVPARAGDRIGIGVKAGTLGLGVDLTGRLNDWFSLRGTVNQYDYKESVTESDIDYDGTLKLGAYGVMLDIFPMKGSFRLSAGLLKNRNELELTGTPTADIQEEEKQLEDDIDSYQLWPVIALGISFRL